MRRCLRHPTFSRFDRTPICDRHSHGQTHGHCIYRAKQSLHGKSEIMRNLTEAATSVSRRTRINRPIRIAFSDTNRFHTSDYVRRIDSNSNRCLHLHRSMHASRPRHHGKHCCSTCFGDTAPIVCYLYVIACSFVDAVVSTWVLLPAC